jgi:hypothetical protein
MYIFIGLILKNTVYICWAGYRVWLLPANGGKIQRIEDPLVTTDNLSGVKFSN